MIENLWGEPRGIFEGHQIWRGLRDFSTKKIGLDSFGDMSETCWKLQQRAAGCYPTNTIDKWLTVSGVGVIVLTQVALGKPVFKIMNFV